MGHVPGTVPTKIPSPAGPTRPTEEETLARMSSWFSFLSPAFPLEQLTLLIVIPDRRWCVLCTKPREVPYTNMTLPKSPPEARENSDRWSIELSLL